ncbi:MAG: energy transducer TonB [Candidatus Accumulibacter sp.]|jgi:protein TonB|nr:energy transducer TonB [Accumulibacter sp.]
MPRSLIIALTLSLVLHGGVLMTGGLRFAPPAGEAALRATLRPPVETSLPETADALLKNTLDDEPERLENPPPPPPEKRGTPVTPSVAGRQMDAVRRKLSEYVFYPEQAKRLGLEGTVTLFVELSGDGRVEDVRVVESSGYPLLDHAAVKGFYALGRLPGESGYWEYRFQLE